MAAQADRWTFFAARRDRAPSDHLTSGQRLGARFDGDQIYPQQAGNESHTALRAGIDQTWIMPPPGEVMRYRLVETAALPMRDRCLCEYAKIVS